jgi:hypothetical protein
MYMHTSVLWFSGKTLHSVLEQKKCTFLNSYALPCIAPSLTYILNHNIFYSTHTHVTYSLKHNIHQNVNAYILLHRPLIKVFLSWQENNILCFTQTCPSAMNTKAAIIKVANSLTGLKLQDSIERHSVIYSPILNVFPWLYLPISYRGRAICKTTMPFSTACSFIPSTTDREVIHWYSPFFVLTLCHWRAA